MELSKQNWKVSENLKDETQSGRECAKLVRGP
jgi:hypothetical protein